MSASSVADLPQGYRWHAFHIPQDGIAECSFPMRLTCWRRNIENRSQEEPLGVIGTAANKCFQISFGASCGGTTFHVGTGSMISQIKLRLPTRSAPTAKQDCESFLATQTPHRPGHREYIEKDDFSIESSVRNSHRLTTERVASILRPGSMLAAVRSSDNE